MNDYSYQALHRRAAEYYRTIRSNEEPSSIKDLEPHLLEFHHLTLAQDYQSATDLMNEISERYLILWGFLERVVEMRTILLHATSDSSLKVDNLLHLADAYRMMGQTQQAISAGGSALKVASETSDERRMCTAFCTLGGIYRKHGRYSDAIDNLEKALVLARELDEIDVELQASMQLGQILYYINRVEEAQTILRDAYLLAEKENNRRMQADLRGQLGYTALWLGHIVQAVELCRDALRLAEEVNNKRARGYWHLALGEAYLAGKQLDKAKQNFSSSMRIADEISDSHLKSYAGSFLAQSLLHEGRLEKALECIESLREIDNPQHNDFIAMLHGVVLARLGHTEASLEFFKRALDLNTVLIEKNPTNILEAQCTRGIVYLCLALLETVSDTTFSHLLSAQEVFGRTFEDTVAEGVIKRCLDIIDEMRILDGNQLIPLVSNAFGRSMREHLNKIGVFVELHVNNFDLAADFYTKLGFVTVLRTREDGGYLTMRKGSSIINFYGGSEIINDHPFFRNFEPDAPVGYRVEIVVSVDNIVSEFESIKQAIPSQALVEELQEQPWKKKDFRVVDPFGFYLRFTEKIDWLQP